MVTHCVWRSPSKHAKGDSAGKGVCCRPAVSSKISHYLWLHTLIPEAPKAFVWRSAESEGLSMVEGQRRRSDPKCWDLGGFQYSEGVPRCAGPRAGWAPTTTQLTLACRQLENKGDFSNKMLCSDKQQRERCRQEVTCVSSSFPQLCSVIPGRV